MRYYDWIRKNYTIESSEELTLDVSQLHRHTKGTFLRLVNDLGMDVPLTLRPFRKAAKEQPPGTKFRFLAESLTNTSTPGLRSTVTVMTYRGIAFDPENWRGNLHRAAPKQVIDLLHTHGTEVLDELRTI